MAIDAATARVERYPYSLSIPIAASLLVLVAGLFAVAQVRDAGTLGEISEVHLVEPIGYLLMAPMSDVLDALTLLSARQHVAGLLGLLALWIAWRLTRPRQVRYAWRAILASFATLMLLVVTAYVSLALVPRPMAYLEAVDPDLIRIDFHSHSNSSKDARRTFSIENNRAWHRAGGYDVAYVTDHAALAESLRGHATQSANNGDVVLLSGIEADWKGEHVGLLGPQHTIRDLLSGNLRSIDARRFTAGSLHLAREPILIWNHPRADRLDRLPVADRDTALGVRAIEISNGAPHGMDLVRRKRQQIIELAARHDLALVSGTDNHGWGFVAPNWTLLHLRNWRELNDVELARSIEGAIGDQGRGATRVVERTSVDPGVSAAALALTIVTVPWGVLTTLSEDERLMWIGWIWVIFATRLLMQRRLRPSTRTAVIAVPTG
jgi:hypothetical protein